MKRIISLLLIAALSLSVFSAAAFAAPAEDAATSSENVKGNLSDQLIQIVQERDPERWVAVYIWFFYPAVTYDKTQSDFETYQDYVAYQRQTISAYHTAKNRECFDTIAESYEIEENYLSVVTPMAMVNIKVKDVYAIAQLDCVSSMDYDSENDDLQPGDTGYPNIGKAKYFGRFLDQYQYKPGSVACYREISYHYEDETDESTADWVLVKAYTYMAADSIFMAELGGRLVYSSDWKIPFTCGYGVYDVKEEKFYELTPSVMESYEGLTEVFQSLELVYPLSEYGGYEFYSKISYLDKDYQDAHYHILSYGKGDSYSTTYYGFGFGFDVDWLLVQATATTTLDYMKEDPLTVKVGDKQLTSTVSPWPFYSNLAVFIPSYGEDYGFHALDDIDISAYDGLEEAILSQDLEGLGFEVSSPYHYKDKFEEKYGKTHPYILTGECDYDELYYHQDGDGNTDWALIYFEYGAEPIWTIKTGCFVGDRAIWSIDGSSIFRSSYGVYDVKNDRFLSMQEAVEEGFDGLSDAANQLKLGIEIGDADHDGTLSVLDATRIQKLLAGLGTDMQQWDDVFYVHPMDNDTKLYVSDIDRDGVRSVLDATRIQKILAGLVDRHGEKDENYLTTGVVPHERDTKSIAKTVNYTTNYYHSYYEGSAQSASYPVIAPDSKRVTLITSYPQFVAFYGVTASNYSYEFFKKNVIVDIVVSGSDTKRLYNVKPEIGTDGSTLQVKTVMEILDLTKVTENWKTPNFVHCRMTVSRSEIGNIDSIEAWDQYKMLN